MSKVLLSIGSNQENRSDNLSKCREKLSNYFGNFIKASSIYESEAWGFSGHAFLNQLIIYDIPVSPFECLRIIQKIENEMGRTRSKQGYESRLIDIDILYYDQLKIKTRTLEIPHPHIKDRMFILKPLSEILNKHLYPLFNISPDEMIKDCKDRCWVKKYK